MSDNEDKILDEEQWKKEAEKIINDVKCNVREIAISPKLGSSNFRIFLNVTTVEGFKHCIEVSRSGFTVIGNDHDTIEFDGHQTFETLYSLLDFISPQYRHSFVSELVKKLNELANTTVDDESNES